MIRLKLREVRKRKKQVLLNVFLFMPFVFGLMAITVVVGENAVKSGNLLGIFACAFVVFSGIGCLFLLIMSTFHNLAG